MAQPEYDSSSGTAGRKAKKVSAPFRALIQTLEFNHTI